MKRSTKARYQIGEKPGKGEYKCVKCGWWTVTLDSAEDRLPPCGNCGDDQDVEYKRIS
jgi:transcription elongation factor Elf1